ncbi:hypothetical protein PF005_g3625 [Phytophthora fragariae]|uniref:Uncharacterized protein n=1 Tax=Phytophthora fragariae TaxID=53985 RepID=A0A6A3Z7R5_9STRA|nr:hypothetical protein PF005_g3625 [Phytophthora fragariae]
MMPGETYADFAAGLRDATGRNLVEERDLLAQFYRCLNLTVKQLVKQRNPMTLEHAVDFATEIRRHECQRGAGDAEHWASVGGGTQSVFDSHGWYDRPDNGDSRCRWNGTAVRGDEGSTTSARKEREAREEPALKRGASGASGRADKKAKVMLAGAASDSSEDETETRTPPLKKARRVISSDKQASASDQKEVVPKKSSE